MTGPQENIVGVGPMCDVNCTVTLSKYAVHIYSPNGTPIITGWREPDGPHLWRMSQLLNPEDIPPLSLYPITHKISLQDFSAYELPSVEAPVRYFHAAAGFPVRNT